MVQLAFPWTWPATRIVSRSLRFPAYVEVEESGQCRRVAGVVIKSVLSVIEDRSGVRNWFTCSNNSLAGEASVSLSQAKRALTWLDRSGLIITQTKRAGLARTERQIRPNWDAYFDSEFSTLGSTEKEELKNELRSEHEGGTKVPVAHNKFPVAHTKVPVRPPKVPPEGPQRIHDKLDRSYRRSNDRGDRVIGLKVSSEEIDFAHELISKVTRFISLKACDGWTDRQNWEAVAKIAVMTVQREIPEGWLADALETISRKSDRVGVGYLLSIFRKKFESEGKAVGRELKRVHLPPELEFSEFEHA